MWPVGCVLIRGVTFGSGLISGDYCNTIYKCTVLKLINANEVTFDL